MSLVLQVQIDGESVQIGDDITVRLVRVEGSTKARLAIDAPRDLVITRVPARPRRAAR